LAANDQPHEDLALLETLVLEAGKIGLQYFKSTNEVWYKNGSSPVSEADKEIDTFLRTSFAKKRPDYGWLSEETEDNVERLEKQTVVIADPIDGTRGFIAGRDEWCISAAIVTDGRPVHAVLHCPALNRTFLASKGSGLILRGKPVEDRIEREQPLLTGSKKVIELLKEYTNEEIQVMELIPSLAYRLALVATGDLAGAFARQGASEWDVAAADLILEEAGCCLTDNHCKPLSYNRPKVIVPSLVAADKTWHGRIFQLAKNANILH